LFFYIGFRLFSEKLLFTNTQINLKTKLLNAIALLALASFGIYYSFFGCMVIAMCTIMAAAVNRSWRRVSEGILALSFTVLGVLLNVLPSLIHLFQNGENREGVNRFASESELYALKITQLLLPRGDHRLDSFFEFASKYNSFFPLVTENISASMGAVGSLGFLLLVVVSLISPFFYFKSNDLVLSNKATAQMRFQVLAALTLGLVLMGTLGGFSSLFAMLISSSIRSWNRVSIFITFISVLACLMAIELLVQKYTKHVYLKFISITVAFIILVLGILDQTSKPCHSCTLANSALAKNDRLFIETIEKSLPKGSAIYQLPYVPYSDSGPVNNLGAYDQARGHVHSKHLKWSFGSVRGREGDWFYRKFALLPLHEQVTVVSAMGFAGIYIDRRGFIDASPENDKKCAKYINSQVDRLKNNCVTNSELEQSISQAIATSASQPKLISKDSQIIFLPLKPYVLNQEELTQANAYILPIGYKLVNGVPIQLEGGFEDPIDLRKDDPDMPVYVGGFSGLSGISIGNEGRVGRWSDALFAKRVTVWLAKPLPKKFTLQIRAQAAGLNPCKSKLANKPKILFLAQNLRPKVSVLRLMKPSIKLSLNQLILSAPLDVGAMVIQD
jgi:phosphoglycerol transferase